MEIMFDELPAKLKEKLIVTSEGCWLWTGAKSPAGYGRVNVLGRLWKVSKIIHTLFISPVNPEHDASHICSNKSCCRPHQKHVIFETHDDNMKRTRISHTKKCRKGHDLSGDNLVIKGGILRCSICYRAASRARQKIRRDSKRISRE